MLSHVRVTGHDSLLSRFRGDIHLGGWGVGLGEFCKANLFTMLAICPLSPMSGLSTGRLPHRSCHDDMPNPEALGWLPSSH